MKRFSRNGLYLNLHPARQPEHDPVLVVHRHAAHQAGPQALIELGLRVPIKIRFDGRRTSSGATELSERVREANGCAACEDARQVLHVLDEPFDLPAPDHDLIDLLHDGIALLLGFLIPGNQCIVALGVFLLVLCHPSISGDQVVHRLGVDAKLLIQNPAFLLQRRGITEPGHLSMAVM